MPFFGLLTQTTEYSSNIPNNVAISGSKIFENCLIIDWEFRVTWKLTKLEILKVLLMTETYNTLLALCYGDKLFNVVAFFQRNCDYIMEQSSKLSWNRLGLNYGK